MSSFKRNVKVWAGRQNTIGFAIIVRRMRGMVGNTILLTMRHKMEWITVLSVFYTSIMQIKARLALRDVLELASYVRTRHWGGKRDEQIATYIGYRNSNSIPKSDSVDRELSVTAFSRSKKQEVSGFSLQNGLHPHHHLLPSNILLLSARSNS